MNDILQAFQTVLPYIKYLFDEDISVAISDREAFLLNLEGETIQMNSHSGDPIPQGGGVRIALETGQRIVRDVPKEVYGVAFKSYAIPIMDEDENVVGVLSLAKNYEKREKMTHISKELNAAIEQISNIIEEFSIQLKSLQDQNTEISGNVSSVHETTKQTDSILEIIHKIAKKSNLLGLNASIEAARSGEAGRGFMVVAKEIQTMGKNTLDSVGQVEKLLNEIVDKIQDLYDKIRILDESYVTQAEELQNIIQYIDEINEKSEELADFTTQV